MQVKVRNRVIGTLVLSALIAVIPKRVARAYVDPNSAGPLYQMLFPMLVAIASAIAAGRRILRRLWDRFVTRIKGRPAESPVERTSSNAEEGT